jgi:iron complex transport system substrate-binding protein
VVFLFTQIPANDTNCENIRNKLKEIDPSITVVGDDFLMAGTYVDEMRKLGYILDKEAEAEEFIEFYSGWMEKINDRLEGISEEDKPDVYFEMQWPSTYSSCSVGLLALHEPVVVAGGNNIFGDFDGAVFEVDPEAVVEKNPDIILKYDPAKLAELRDEIISRPELQNVTAVRDGRVYIISWDILLSGGKQPLGMAYMAKWFHPELFKDIDFEEIEEAYREYLRYQGFECDSTEIGALVYPEKYPEN